ncbi:hypothetical protein ACA910_009035 [Epithemia clementina (nom. ined.)]
MAGGVVATSSARNHSRQQPPQDQDPAQPRRVSPRVAAATATSTTTTSTSTTASGRASGGVFKWWQQLVIVALVAFSFRMASLQYDKEFEQKVDFVVESMMQTANDVASIDFNSILSGSDGEEEEEEDDEQDGDDNDATNTERLSKNSKHALNGTSLHHPIAPITIIPKPTRLKQSKQGTFALVATTKIYLSNTIVKPEGEILGETLRASTGFRLPIVNAGGCEQGHICLLLLQETEAAKHKKKKKSALLDDTEAYVLDVGPNGAVVGSFTRKGLFYGTQTLLQLLPPAIYATEKQSQAIQWTIPFVHIEDAPRYTWRGMHLDVARHFMPKEFVLKFINLLAIHKMNSLHLHLSDDQGWRLEIRKYPLLTKISAWRNETLIGHQDHFPHKYDGKRYGGFFTQQDIREIVAFAARRHINVVPEIEMPGHTQAVFAAYPKCSCRPDLHYTAKREWGVSDNVFCAGNDHTFEFLQDILEEVMELFPSEYIHIGGDECEKSRWETCPLCQKRMEDENLVSVKELQSYFIRRIEKFVNSKGRKMIGWDEIFEGGLAPHATVMSWRGSDPAMQAAWQNHHAILATVDKTYFDWYQSKNTSEPLAWGGFTPLEKVYGFELIPQDSRLPPEKAHYILGGQGQLWTEYMPTSKQVEYMAFPRAAALAETLWAKRLRSIQAGEYEDFFHRLVQGHLPRLDTLNVNYRNPTHMYEPDKHSRGLSHHHTKRFRIKLNR